MVGRAGGPKGVRACLPRSRNNGSITAPLPPDSVTSSPLETLSPPFSLSPVPRTLSSSCCLPLFLPCALSFFLRLALRRSYGTSERRSSPVPSLPSLRFPRPPSFLYTTSFAVVGEGETPAFAVGEAVLFFPLIKADRCGSGCRDDGTGRGDGGGRCTGRVTRGAGRQRRWAEVVGRRWRRARHSMTCHVPTLPLTQPSPPRSRLDATVAIPYTRLRYNHPPSPRSPAEDACMYMENTRASAL